jgi:hypothetical protein
MGCVSSKADETGGGEANQAAKYAAPAEQPAAGDAGKADAPPAHGPPTPSEVPEAKVPVSSTPTETAHPAPPAPATDATPAASNAVAAPAAPAPAPATKRQSAAGLPDGADDGQVVSKLRTDCKIRDVYTLGKVLGTGGELLFASRHTG